MLRRTPTGSIASPSGTQHHYDNPGHAHGGNPGLAHVGTPGLARAPGGNHQPRRARRARASAKAPAPVLGLPPVAVPAAVVDLAGEDEDGPPGPVEERRGQQKPVGWHAKQKKRREVAAQSQVTYRWDYATPKFQPLPEHFQGAWPQ